MEKKYKLKYHGKWIEVKRFFGHYVCNSYDNPDDVDFISYNKAMASRAFAYDDCDLVFEDIEIIEF